MWLQQQSAEAGSFVPAGRSDGSPSRTPMRDRKASTVAAKATILARVTAPVRTWTLRRRARFAVLGLAVLLLVTGVLAVLGQRQAEHGARGSPVVLGSVSHAVLHRADCPVAIVRPDTASGERRAPEA